MKWLEDLLDQRVPAWREDAWCPVCSDRLHPLEVRRHLEAAHGIVVEPDAEKPGAGP